MAEQDRSDAIFEALYRSTLDALIGQGREHVQAESWRFVEEVRGNTGADGYFPDWLLPYSSFVGHITADDGEGGPFGLRAALLRAAQLGYTEGYFAGKDD